MRNELDEESRYIIQKLKTTLKELLMQSLKAKFPYKSSNDIIDMCNQKIIGSIIDEEWKRIIYQIYENEDVAILEKKIIDFIKKKAPLNKPEIVEKLDFFIRNFLFY